MPDQIAQKLEISEGHLSHSSPACHNTLVSMAMTKSVVEIVVVVVGTDKDMANLAVSSRNPFPWRPQYVCPGKPGMPAERQSS